MGEECWGNEIEKGLVRRKMFPSFHLLFIALSLAQLQTATSSPESKNVIPYVGNIPCSKLYEFIKPLLKGYEYFPGVGFYKFYSGGTNYFSKAKKVCESDGAHLAIPNSYAEANALHTIYSRFPDTHRFAFIGFHDQSSEGKYVTIFGDPLYKTGYSKWSSGEPNQYGGNEDCGSIHRNGGLNDIPCEVSAVKIPFFCEHKALQWIF
ncbi:hypothetical protein J437_LFUL011573 [Ladona fulva]|uniref:C-type lectin domain-containing protein n=1 Tax=Ladona fulva TaxID=123851 RepID=A0A8K0P3C2_LADFU|nr:hypothetical protein J437_LFUL011573 [Ladona fulva]